MPKKGECCPVCGCPFNDWFVWDGERHCFPCWKASRHTEVIREESGRHRVDRRQIVED